jgi:hypothetical protein
VVRIHPAVPIMTADSVACLKRLTKRSGLLLQRTHSGPVRTNFRPIPNITGGVLGPALDQCQHHTAFRPGNFSAMHMLYN